MAIEQYLAIIIFATMFLLIVLDKFERHYTTLGCGIATLVIVFGAVMHSKDAIIRTLNLNCILTSGFWYSAGAEESSTGINWATIIFIAGMMVMVEGMAIFGFFRWLCMRLAKLVNYKPMALLIAFMAMSGILAMFIDSITVIMFLAAVTVELGKLLKFNPIPMVLSEIFCANLGGSATMCGDPPNIIIGTSLGYSFFDFITNTGVIVGICLVMMIIYFVLCFRKDMKKIVITEEAISKMPNPKDEIKDKRKFVECVVVFLIVVAMLITHSMTGLTVATIGVFATVAILLVAGKKSVEVLKKVDYKTILFFIGLFMAVSGLEETGILELLAGFIGKVSGGNIMMLVAIIIWISAIASAVVDNIPFAATMIPVIKAIAASTGVDLSILAWALAMGTDVGGSATPIGASANVVGTSVAARNGYVISWGKYCKTAVPGTILVIAVSMLLIFVRYC
ncbi:MAG: SLC13 family permease [Agathobacter sp.]|nr:SLC13 family permease [Agathobacter sp.]